MAFEHGKGQDFRIDNSGGTLTDISAYVTGVDGFPETVATHDVTTFTKDSINRLAGLKDLTFTVTGIYDKTVDDVLAAIIGLTGSYQYGPQGTTAGEVQYTGECILQSYQYTGPVNNPVGWTARFERTGDGTRGTY